MTEACQTTGWQVHAQCEDRVAGRRVFGERMERRRGEDLRGEFKQLERGWCLGGEEFRQELLEQVETRPRPSHFEEAVQEAEAAQAERLVVAGRNMTMGAPFKALPLWAGLLQGNLP